jgi:hypothetical protein
MTATFEKVVLSALKHRKKKYKIFQRIFKRWFCMDIKHVDTNENMSFLLMTIKNAELW